MSMSYDNVQISVVLSGMSWCHCLFKHFFLHVLKLQQIGISTRTLKRQYGCHQQKYEFLSSKHVDVIKQRLALNSGTIDVEIKK